ncbi:PaaI family thioesterase [Pseudophaeobacter leonis]|uniref:PaaI family thioesterase n=1 Tax=Pseudophaeobacter leonis TaxID=1144477 RepID=UPI001F4EA902|nr:PaaI family thioesterase [Pseudophaeobacter leonis]
MTTHDIAPEDRPEDRPEGWRELKIDGFMALIGPLLRATARDRKHSYALQTNEGHKNHLGVIHGGVITSLLDQVMAITAWNAADRQPTVTVQMETRFTGGARVGDFLQIQASIRQATRSLIFVEADITCDDRLIASASAVMKISKTSGKASEKTS